MLTAWMHVTDRCNFRCTYCYLPHNQVDMSVDIGTATVDTVLRSAFLHDYQQVFFKYAGGEPLLRFPFITDLHRYAKAQAAEYGVEVYGNILSNGTLLTPAILEDITELNLSLVLSLDGLAGYHDRQRRYASGSGSCGDVLLAVELALSYGVTPYISIVVTGENAMGLPNLISWILERDLPFNLSFARENECSFGQKAVYLEEEKIIKGMLAAYEVIEQQLPRRSLLNSLLDNANLSTRHVRPCSAGEHYMVFDCLGNISKCQMEYSTPVTSIEAYDPLADLQNSVLGVQNISIEDKVGCEQCEWKYWCAGGCPLSTFRATGRYDVRSPNCAIYKKLYPEVIRLENLRVKKYVSHFEGEAVA
ncbi:radical SAM protein [Desulfobulbus sp. US4]|nr:radical SAM protein [Desulfobulbus sp. US4]